jgi:aminoglycoside phosphotransferase family enzyme
MRRDGCQDMRSQRKKQGCCKQGHQDVHGDSILGYDFLFIKRCIQPECWKTDAR